MAALTLIDERQSQQEGEFQRTQRRVLEGGIK
jgi:hypothetical protein